MSHHDRFDRPKLSAKGVLHLIEVLGLDASHADGEFRVNFRTRDGGDEETAYYTQHADDALNTARLMAASLTPATTMR